MTNADVILTEAVRLWRLTLSRGDLVGGCVREQDSANEVARALVALSRAPRQDSNSRPVVDEAAALIADAVSLAQVVALLAVATEADRCPAPEKESLDRSLSAALGDLRTARVALQALQAALGPSTFTAKATLMAERSNVTWEEAVRMERNRFNS